MLSVIVPVYNEHSTLPLVVARICNALPEVSKEIIIVDNDSTDDSASIAARYPITLLSESEIRTSYAARNRGINHARGEIIAFTDADCIPAPDWAQQRSAQRAVSNPTAHRLAVDPYHLRSLRRNPV